MKPKLFTLILALVASVGITQASVTINGIAYNFNETEQTAEVTRGSYSGSIIIPSSVEYNSVTYSVTSIGKEAFYSCSGLTSVTIGNSITSIGDRAFYDCYRLTSVTIGNSVTSIGKEAFWYCKGLTSVSIPNSVTSIGEGAFSWCKGLTSVSISNSVTSIGERAFSGCKSLTSVSIPNSVISIGNDAFSGCSSLTSVVWNAKNCANSGGFGSQVESFTFGNEVESIPASCCSGMDKLTSITIPSSVISIGNDAFSGCSSLTSVVWNAKNCANSGSFGSQVESFTFGNEVESIPASCCYWMNKLTSITIPSSVISIGNEAFYNCSGLTSVTIGNSVTSIGKKAFYYCTDLISITIPNSVTSIGEYAFEHCTGLTSVSIPNNVTSIGSYAFQNCSGLTSITIPNGVTSIGVCAFYYCTDLISITIPNSVTSIGEYAFSWCGSLSVVNMESSSPAEIGTDIFSNTASSLKIFVPCSSVQTYKEAAGWSIYSSCIQGSISSVKADSSDDSKGSVTYPQTICENVITALPNYGYHFTQWSDGNIENPRAVDPTENKSYTAEFEANTYTIVTVSSNSDWGITSGDGSISYLENVTISATPNYGYHFVQWADNNTDNPRTIIITQDTTFTAIFAKNKYIVTKIADKSQGSVSGPSQAEYLDQVSLSAVPEYGYHFTQWSDGVKDNPRTFELTRDTTFTAEFAPNQYSLTLQCDSEQGIVEGAGTFDFQAQAQISATPAYGYHFSSWSDGNTDNPRKYTITKDVTLTANFAPNIYSISLSCNSEQGQVTGNGSYTYLSNRSIEAIANYGYHFAKWSDGNTSNPRTIELRQDTAFVAIFAIDKSGTCGDNLLLTWQYDSSNQILTISGEGDLTANKRYGVEAIGEMRELIIEDGVGILGDDAFANIKTLKSVSLGKDVRKLQERVFYNCYNLEAIYSYRRTPASALTNTFEEVDKYACTVYVMAGSEDMFRSATGWKDFYTIRAIGASETTVASEEVTVAPTETTAAVTWPSVENAATYELVIKDKSGNVVCTLIFNANGQLTEIAFAAPGRSQRSGQIAGFSFTVTGLDSGTGYDLTINAKDSQGEVINTTTQSFTTVSNVTTGVDATLNASPVRKQLIDGLLYILRDGKTYTVQGQEVR